MRSNDAVLLVRLPKGLLDRVTLAYGAGAAPERVRYLLERDLSERARKRAGKPVQRDLEGNASE